MNRRAAREVRIGEVAIGGRNPIAIQSMTTTDTNNVPASVRQTIELARAGAAIVRLTVPSVRAAESLRRIHREVREAGIRTPLVADIHYTPNAAMAAADFVEKVRINPGNFADRPDRMRPGETLEEGASRVAELFGPLVLRLKERGAALRIGVNHGSLSERITARYGDTPEGMVESALEYIAVCERMGFDRIVVSLKSSIPAVTVAANRLFAAKTDAAGGRYPLHLGVTEAGSGEEGRVRSAAGIGALLSEGLGDTIRVSLSEDPLREIPAAREILETAERAREAREGTLSPLGVARRGTMPLAIGERRVGGEEPLAVLAGPECVPDGTEPPDLHLVSSPAEVAAAGEGGKPIVLDAHRPIEALRACAGKKPRALLFAFPSHESIDWEAADRLLAVDRIIPVAALRAERAEEIGPLVDRLRSALPRALEGGALIGAPFGPAADLAPALERALSERELGWPQFLLLEAERGIIENAVALAPPLLDSIGDLLVARGLCGLRSAWEILQGTRRRITRVEYISCPSCGRTLFDLEEATARVRERTSHLKNVKIAIMGCIVNGPGEMADADVGYVGSGPGRVDLYIGPRRIEKSVPESEAVDRLIDLIRALGRWTDPPDSGSD